MARTPRYIKPPSTTRERAERSVVSARSLESWEQLLPGSKAEAIDVVRRPQTFVGVSW